MYQTWNSTNHKWISHNECCSNAFLKYNCKLHEYCPSLDWLLVALWEKSPTTPPLFWCSCTCYFYQNTSYILHWLLNEHAIWSAWPTIYETQKMIVLHVASISNSGKSHFWFIRCLMGKLWIIRSSTRGTPRCKF